MATKRLSNLDMNGLQLLAAVLEVVGADPGTVLTAGRVIYRSDLGVLKVRDASAWQTIATLANRVSDLTAPNASFSMNSQKITNLADPTTGTDAANRQYVLGLKVTDLTAPTTAFAMNGQKITGLADGTAATDAATKGQVDAASAGLDVKASVRAATTANIATLAGGAPNTLDGVTLAANDRILVKDQTTGSQNGIYTVTTLGTGANGTWTRAGDADVSAEVNSGMFTFVEEGALAADTGWVLTTNNPITLNTTALAFSKFTAAATGVGRFTGLIGDAAATSIAVSHGLGQQHVIAQAFDASTNQQVECDITNTSSSQTTFAFAVAPASNAIRVVIVG